MCAVYPDAISVFQGIITCVCGISWHYIVYFRASWKICCFYQGIMVCVWHILMQFVFHQGIMAWYILTLFVFYQGIMARVYETAVVLLLLGILVCGIAWVASALIDNDNNSRQALFGGYLKIGPQWLRESCVYDPRLQGAKIIWMAICIAIWMAIQKMYPFTRDIHHCSIQQSASHCCSWFSHCYITIHLISR